MAIPIPRAFLQPEIINDARVAFVARNRAVVERAPERFAAAPRITPEIRLRFVARPFEQIFEFRQSSRDFIGDSLYLEDDGDAIRDFPGTFIVSASTVCNHLNISGRVPSITHWLRARRTACHNPCKTEPFGRW